MPSALTGQITACRFALAAMILGGWMPFGALEAGLLFSFADALQIRLQSLVSLAPDMARAQIAPYAVTVIVLAGFVRKRIRPNDYTSYEKE